MAKGDPSALGMSASKGPNEEAFGIREPKVHEKIMTKRTSKGKRGHKGKR